MKCPVCTTPDLVMTERQGVEIDYCPQCRGVWLDRGELDKILDRTRQEFGAGSSPAPSASHHPGAAPPYPPPPQPPQYNRHAKPDDSDVYPAQGYGKPYKKRKHWLLEIFD